MRWYVYGISLLSYRKHQYSNEIKIVSLLHIIFYSNRLMENKFSLLSDTEAAIYLGITKELLFSYIRNAPKGYKGDIRRKPKCSFL